MNKSFYSTETIDKIVKEHIYLIQKLDDTMDNILEKSEDLNQKFKADTSYGNNYVNIENIIGLENLNKEIKTLINLSGNNL